MRETMSLDAILEDFDPKEMSGEEPEKLEPVTFWVRKSCKAKYESLQGKTRRKFSKQTRRVLETLFELAYARTS